MSTIASIIITSISIIYIVKTLREMKKQREMSYIPEIIPVLSNYYFVCNKEEYYLVSDQANINSNEENEKYKNDEIFLKFQNIGLGVARNVYIELIYDDNDFKDNIKENVEKIPEYSVDWQEGSPRKLVLSKKKHESNNNPNIDVNIIPIVKEGQLDEAIVPVSQINKEYKYGLTDEFIIMLKFNIRNKLNTKNGIEDIKLPEIKFKLEYSGLGDEKYHKEYKLEMDNFSTYQEKDEYKLIKGNITYKEI